MHEPRNGLPAAVKMWPTPTTNPVGGKNIDLVDKTGNPPEHPNQRFFDKRTGRLVQKGLETVAKMWPSPDANCYKGGARRRQLTDPAAGVTPNGGQLNPQWVEWLMGFPDAWTDLED